MPFLTKTTEGEPRVLLEQVAPNLFKLRRSFRYREPGTVDGLPKNTHTVPKGARTDLASVPWPLWWLVASYGRHTKAVLLHDALIEDEMTLEERRDADRLLFVANKESGFGDREKRKTSWARRWLMWSAVALFGTMKEFAPLRLVVFVAHLATFVGLLAYVVAVNVWPRVDWLWAWLSTAASAAEQVREALAGLLAYVWPFEWTPDVWLVAAVIGAAGILWAFEPSVDTRLGLALWPWAVVGSIVVIPPTALILIAIAIVALIDTPGSIRWSIAHGEGVGGGVPVVGPTRDIGAR